MRTGKGPILTLAGALLLLLLFGLAWVSRPGLYQDELLFLDATFPNRPTASILGSIPVFGHRVPTMLMGYLGAAKGLFWRAVFLVWAPSVYSVRVPAVLLSGLGLLLFFLWARRYYTPAIAALAVLLAAADPVYIFTSRLDWGPVVLQRLLAAAGLLFAARWLDARETPAGPPAEQQGPARSKPPAGSMARLGWLAASGLCFGLGLWDKATFAWFLIAVAASLLILFPRDFLRRLSRPAVVVFAAALCAGAYPLLAFNLSQGGGSTYHSVHIGFARPEIVLKLTSLAGTLDGRWLSLLAGPWMLDPAAAAGEGASAGFFAVLPSLALRAGTLLAWVLGLALLAACLARSSRRQIIFPLLMTGLMWVQVLPFREGGGTHHFSLAYPFPHLAIAASAAWAWRRLHGFSRLVPAAATGALLLSFVAWDARTVAQFRDTGGVWYWSDASYDLAAFLEKRQPAAVMCMDWGFNNPLMLLSHGRLNQQPFFSEVAFSPEQDFSKHVARLVALLSRPNTVYLFHAGDYQGFKAVLRVFDAALLEAGMREKVIATFRQRHGEELVIVSEVVPGSAAPAPTVDALKTRLLHPPPSAFIRGEFPAAAQSGQSWSTPRR